MNCDRLENPLLFAEVDLRTGLNIFDDRKNPHYCDRCDCEIPYWEWDSNNGYCSDCVDNYTCCDCGKVCMDLDINGRCADCAIDRDEMEE